MKRASMPAAAMLAVAASTLALTAGAVHAAQSGALPAYIDAAIANSARPPEDTSRDANRKPGPTLAFAGVKPGMRVLELAPGKGYYTRLLSLTVGPTGKVFSVTSAPKPDAPPPTVQAIAADSHFSNVTPVVKKVTDPLVLPEKVDLVWTSQNYHDFHNIPDVGIDAINKRVFDALKPGGIYLVLDHSAQAGSGARDTNTLHRIDEDTVKQEVEAAGFKLVGESNILRNKADPRTAKVFEPPIQGHTDQFILKFQKP
jgi:predicted methyltransferase